MRPPRPSPRRGAPASPESPESPAAPVPPRSSLGTSTGRAGGAGRTSPCRGVGQRPTPTIYSLTNSCVRQHALNLPKSVLPKVFLAKRRNNLRFPFWQGFSWPFSVLRGGFAAPSPKHGVRSPPCPSGLRAGRAPYAHARPAPCAVPSTLCPFVVLRVLCDSRAALPNFSKLPLLRPACASTPLICSKSVKSAVPLRRTSLVIRCDFPRNDRDARDGHGSEAPRAER